MFTPNSDVWNDPQEGTVDIYPGLAYAPRSWGGILEDQIQ